MDWSQLKQYSLKVYSTAWCPDCKRLKGILQRQGIAWQEVDIDADAGAAEDLARRAGHRAIPYVEVDGKGLVKGWHKDAPGRFDEARFLADVAALLGQG